MEAESLEWEVRRQKPGARMIVFTLGKLQIHSFILAPGFWLLTSHFSAFREVTKKNYERNKLCLIT